MCQNVHFSVKWGQQHPLQVLELELPVDTTVDQLKQELYSRTGILPQNQKLLNKVHLTGEVTLASAGVENGSKLLLLGHPTEEIERCVKEPPAAAVRYIIPAVSASEESARQRRRAEALDSVALFGRVEVLREFPHSHEAEALLDRLTKDLGVKNIMKKHGWYVGVLKELTPLNLKINGYNRNRGAEIAIKLRTLTPLGDDEGFSGGFSWRCWGDIVDTMLHELTHCQCDGHDAQFTALNRQLCEEVRTLNWTKSVGRAVGEGTHYSRGGYRNPNPRHMEDSIEQSTRATVTPSSAPAGGHVLGGASGEMGLVRALPPSVVAGLMAEARELTQRERALVDECGNQGSDEVGREDEDRKLAYIPAFTSPSTPPTGSEPVRISEHAVSLGTEDVDEDDRETQTQAQTHGSKEAPSSCLEPCPVCGLCFDFRTTEQQVTQHVNECLTASTSSTSHTKEATSSPNNQCPVCGLEFEATATERFMTNHVERCLLLAP